MCSYLEGNDDEQLTLTHLEDKMRDFLNCKDTLLFGIIYLNKLNEKYGESIVIAESKGLSNIVTFRVKTSDILRSYWKTVQRNDKEAQRQAIIKTVAGLIKSDLKAKIPSVTDYYPKSDDLTIECALRFLPETLRNMLQRLFVGKNTQHRIASIGQAIIQAVRPRAVIAPLQIGRFIICIDPNSMLKHSTKWDIVHHTKKSSD